MTTIHKSPSNIHGYFELTMTHEHCDDRILGFLANSSDSAGSDVLNDGDLSSYPLLIEDMAEILKSTIPGSGLRYEYVPINEFSATYDDTPHVFYAVNCREFNARPAKSGFIALATTESNALLMSGLILGAFRSFGVDTSKFGNSDAYPSMGEINENTMMTLFGSHSMQLGLSYFIEPPIKLSDFAAQRSFAIRALAHGDLSFLMHINGDKPVALESRGAKIERLPGLICRGIEILSGRDSDLLVF